MADDPLVVYLSKAKLSDPQRAGLWDVYQASTNPADLAERLKSIELPDDIKADLWDLKAGRPLPAKPSESPAKSTTVLDMAKDLAIGAGKGAVHTVLDLASSARKVPVYVPGVGFTQMGGATDAIGNAIGGAVGKALYGTKAEPVSGDTAIEQARQDTAHSNPTQQIGGALETVAELALPGPKVAQAIPTAAKAGAKFQGVMAAAKHIPVDVNAPGQVALRIQQLAEHGGSMPMAVNKFLRYITDPNRPALTYEVARDFASNISRLSANEYARLTPVIQREVAELRVVLNKAVGDAAAKAGKGKEYAEAMTEFAKAMKLRNFFDNALAGAKKALPYAATGGGIGAGGAAGYWTLKHLKDLLGE